MNFCIMSDLHLEFGRGQFEIPKCDVIILAGDTFVPYLSEFKKNKQADLRKRYHKFFQQCNDMAWKTIMIPGNHESYFGVLSETEDQIKSFIDPFKNIVLLQNETFEVNDISIFGSTLWTDLNKSDPTVEATVKLQLNDYYQIYERVQDSDILHQIQPYHITQLNKIAKLHLTEFLMNDSNNVKIVVTHHAPTWASVQGHHRENCESYAYANTGLDDLIFDHGPDIWIHGHMHYKNQYFHGEKTKIISNPRGYFGMEPQSKHWTPLMLQI